MTTPAPKRLDTPILDAPIKVGISECLLGQNVRFDGGHKRDAFLADILGRYVQWIPVCPEVEAGMGVPREPMRLVEIGSGIRLVTTRTGEDHTPAMRSYAAKRVRELAGEDLCGYVLKKDSPSCGMERVRVYRSEGMPQRSGRGLFAETLLARFPHLPVEEEGRLCDPRLRENFIERIFAYRRLTSLFAGHWALGDLVAFHTAHKYQLLAHSPAAYAALGRFVATAKKRSKAEIRAHYGSQFMAALQTLATSRRNANVLSHMLGYCSEALDPDSRQELVSLIEDYRKGLVPLVAPLVLIRHYVRRFEVAYLQGQTYLQPHPKELMLRNHV